MPYRHPTLVELVAEARFRPGAIEQKRLLDLANKVRDLGQTEMQIAPVLSFPQNIFIGVPAPVLMPAQQSAKLLCWNEGRNKLVQFQESAITVHNVGHYPGWSEFNDLFCKVYDISKDLLAELKPEVLSVTTIDQIVVDKKGFSLGRYLNCGGPCIPSEYSDCASICDLNMGRGIIPMDKMNVAVNITVREQSVEKWIIQIHSIIQEQAEEDTKSQLLKLHDMQVDRFEKLITDATRHEVMGGKS